MVLFQSVVSGVLSGGVYALLGLGFALTLGSLGFVNFAHGSFIVMGMYLAYSGSQWLGLSPILLAPAVTMVLFVFAALAYPVIVAPTLRKGHELQIVVTLLLMNFLTALYEVIYLTDFHAPDGQQKTWLIHIGDSVLAIESAKLISFVVVIAVTTALHLFLQHSPFGKFIRACTSNPVGAQVVGLDVRRISWAVFLLGSGCAGLAGALLMSYSVVEPYLGLDLTVVAFLVSVMSGMALRSIVYSGIMFGVIESVAGTLVSESFARVAVFLIFILVLVLRADNSPFRSLLGGLRRSRRGNDTAAAAGDGVKS